jgi:hypothetical protein
MPEEKRNGSITFWIDPALKKAFFERCGEKGMPSKVMNALINKFMSGEVKVVLPATEAREV